MSVQTDEIGEFARSAVHGLQLVADAESTTTAPLAGGVSNDVIVVRGGDKAFVVKRALSRLRVNEQWDASAERSFTEAEAIRWAGSVRPEAVPHVFAADRERHVIVVSLAPSTLENWKVTLLEGDVRSEIGARLGQLLAAWHLASSEDPALLARFDDHEAFAQLRVRPFYEVSAERNPSVASRLNELVERMARTRTTLVHGDFSPKNVLSSRTGDGLWVIDWEVAHAGDPAFDVAFLLHHLACKAIARPGSREALLRAGTAFYDAYARGVDGGLGAADADYVFAHTGALVLARIDGKSPVDYLTSPQKFEGRAVGQAALQERPHTLDELWSLIDDYC